MNGKDRNVHLKSVVLRKPHFQKQRKNDNAVAKAYSILLKIGYESRQGQTAQVVQYVVESNSEAHHVPSSVANLLCDHRGVAEPL